MFRLDNDENNSKTVTHTHTQKKKQNCNTFTNIKYAPLKVQLVLP